MNLLEGTLAGGTAARRRPRRQSLELDPEALVAHPALAGLRRSRRDRRPPPGAPRRRGTRDRHAAGPPASRGARPARSAGLGDHRPLLVDARAAMTEDVRELAEDTDAVTVGDRGQGSRGHERDRRASTPARGAGGRGRGARRRHARAAFFRPGDRARNLRPQRRKEIRMRYRLVFVGARRARAQRARRRSASAVRGRDTRPSPGRSR